MRRIVESALRRCCAPTAPFGRRQWRNVISAASCSRSLSSAAAAASTRQEPSVSGTHACFARHQSSPLCHPLPPSRPTIPTDVLAKVGRNLHLRPAPPAQHRQGAHRALLRPSAASSLLPCPPPASSASSSSLPRLRSVCSTLSLRACRFTSNFDDLLVPAAHPSRRLTDTYYFSSIRVPSYAHKRSPDCVPASRRGQLPRVRRLLQTRRDRRVAPTPYSTR